MIIRYMSSKKMACCVKFTSFIGSLSIARAKMIATVIVLILIAYHEFIRPHIGPCEQLLTTGEFRADGTWQPQGCLMHNYTKQDLVRCMSLELEDSSKNHVYFIGEHKVRSLYFKWIREVLGKDQTKQDTRPEEGNHVEDDRGLQVDFIWSPYIGDAMVKTLDVAKKSGGSALVVLGPGLHYITESNTTTSEAFQTYSDHLVQLALSVDGAPDSTTFIWKSIEPLTSAKEKQAFRLESVNADIAKYNDLAKEVLNGSRITLWSNIQQLAESRAQLVRNAQIGGGNSTLRNSDDVLLQMLFNHQCNRLLRPNDGSCCVDEEATTWTQAALLVICGVLGVWSLKICCFQRADTRKKSDPVLEDFSVMIVTAAEKKGVAAPSTPSTAPTSSSVTHTLVQALLKMGLILLYCYMCDRANVFLKENKYVSVFNFYLATACIAIAALFSLRPSTQSAVMHRDITDELKGWMQLVILSYHMTGSSFYLPVYMHIRLLVSFYLFLTGFGHFIYAWNGKKLTFVRYCQVMFRLNFLAVMLCLSMNRAYQFYYFVVLVSFWFTVMYATLALPPLLLPPIYGSRHTSTNYAYGIVKIVGLAVVITLLFKHKSVFDLVFQCPLWASLFQGPDQTVDEWFFRWSLDRYSVLYGAAFALVYRWMVEKGWIDDGTSSSLHRSRIRVLLMLLLGVILVPAYLLLLQHCDTKKTCNAWHPFLMWLPILGYIILRNEIGYIRTNFSNAMAWCGKISLELFVCQYHIWLAQDTYGMLVLIPGAPVLNMIVITFILVCVAHEIHAITNTLAGLLVPTVNVKLFRNLVCFAVIIFALTSFDKYLSWFG